MTSTYISLTWRNDLAGQPCDDFSRFWNMDLEPLDQANMGRKGWSRVFVFPLRTPTGDIKRFVMKRQQNYNRVTLTHPFRGRPTFEREYYNICRYQESGIPTVEPMYFARRKCDDGDRSILITEYLEEFQPLNTLWRQNGFPENSIRKKIIESVAFYVRKLHQARLVHRHLQMKHIFVRLAKEQVDVRFIDLEASRRRLFGFAVGFGDLVTLNRSAHWVKATDRLRFILAYFGIDRLDRRTMKICKKIIQCTANKNSKKQKQTAMA